MQVLNVNNYHGDHSTAKKVTKTLYKQVKHGLNSQVLIVANRLNEDRCKGVAADIADYMASHITVKGREYNELRYHKEETCEL